MVGPAPPAPDFVLVEADLTFRLFEASLDRPPARGDLAEQEQWHPGWRVGQVELELTALRIASEDGGQLVTKDPRPEFPHALVGKLVDAWPLGTQANRERLPVVRRHGFGQLPDGGRSSEVSSL